MKRRAFCAAGVSAAALSFLPFRRAFAADVPALTNDGAEIVLRASDVEDFRAGLRGQLLLAGQDGYDEARRIWNGSFDRNPAPIARCAGAADVKHAVSFVHRDS